MHTRETILTYFSVTFWQANGLDYFVLFSVALFLKIKWRDTCKNLYGGGGRLLDFCVDDNAHMFVFIFRAAPHFLIVSKSFLCLEFGTNDLFSSLFLYCNDKHKHEKI